jgi:hypothetical protein
MLVSFKAGCLKKVICHMFQLMTLFCCAHYRDLMEDNWLEEKGCCLRC